MKGITGSQSMNIFSCLGVDFRPIMFMEALFTIVKQLLYLKQPKCPLTEEWVKKM